MSAVITHLTTPDHHNHSFAMPTRVTRDGTVLLSLVWISLWCSGHLKLHKHRTDYLRTMKECKMRNEIEDNWDTCRHTGMLGYLGTQKNQWSRDGLQITLFRVLMLSYNLNKCKSPLSYRTEIEHNQDAKVTYRHLKTNLENANNNGSFLYYYGKGIK